MIKQSPAGGGDIALVPVPAFSDNYIWLLHRAGRAVVVDPGDAAPVQAALDRHGLQLDAILLTHHHADHTGGVLTLQAASGATVYGPATESLPACDQRLAQGDTVYLPALDLSLQVLDVPGHTAGHIAYAGTLPGDQNIVFCGDTLFAAGCGRLFEGTPAQMTESLAKLKDLPLDTLVCCAHEYTLANLRWARAVEPSNILLRKRWDHASRLRAEGVPTLPSTIEAELNTNPFFRLSQASVIDAASAHAGARLHSPVDVFSALREWKNTFK